MPGPSNLLETPFRALQLLLGAIVPSRVSVEPIAARTFGESMARAVFGALALVAIAFAVRRFTASGSLARHVAATTLWASLAAGATFSGTHGPLGVGLLVVAPLAWVTFGLALGSIAYEPRAARGGANANSAARALSWACAGVMLGAVVFAIAASQGAFQIARWDLAALVADPGNERAARALAKLACANDETDAAAATLTACVHSNPSACGCARDAERVLLDAGRYDDTLTLSARMPGECSDASAQGARAEALAGLGRCEDALASSDRAFALDARDPYALASRAACALAMGRHEEARVFAERAIGAGRGVTAKRLLARTLVEEKRFAEAKIELEAVLLERPNDVATLLDLARIAQRAGRVTDAREGYLRALHVQPNLPDARYNLYLIAREAGATSDALEQLDALEAIAPDDRRIAPARRLVGRLK